MGGGSQESSSSQRPVPLRGREEELQGYQLEFARSALDAFKNQAEYQALQQGATPAAIQGLSQATDVLGMLTPAERESYARETYQRGLFGSKQAGELADLELQRIRGGGAASPEQLGLIRVTANAELESGLSDISRYAGQQREAVASELAPRLGLHRSDTPILDRANRISGEAVSAAGRLISDVRGREAQAALNYPLAAAQTSQAQQALGYSRADILAELNQRAFQNRLALTGQVGQQGLGLATGYNVPAAQQSLRPTIAGSSESSGWNWQIGSSRDFKNLLAIPVGEKVLDALRALQVYFWRYKDGSDGSTHVGPVAEDFSKAFDLGDGKTIDYRDLIGFILSAVQELSDRVDAVSVQEA